MTNEEMAQGLKKDPPVLWRVLSWVFKHVHVSFGNHGKDSVEIGFKGEF